MSVSLLKDDVISQWLSGRVLAYTAEVMRSVPVPVTILAAPHFQLHDIPFLRSQDRLINAWLLSSKHSLLLL